MDETLTPVSSQPVNNAMAPVSVGLSDTFKTAALYILIGVAVGVWYGNYLATKHTKHGD